MRLLCCGSRKFDDRDLMRKILFPRLLKESIGSLVSFLTKPDGSIECNEDSRVNMWSSETLLIHGDALGADRLSKEVAREIHFPIPNIRGYPALWDKHGKAAGPIRNQQMLDEGQPTEVFAFHWSPFHLSHAKGTRDMVERSVKANIPTFLHTPAGSYRVSDSGTLLNGRMAFKYEEISLD